VPRTIIKLYEIRYIWPHSNKNIWKLLRLALFMELQKFRSVVSSSREIRSSWKCYLRMANI